jgi:glutamate carboxypeptidase
MPFRCEGGQIFGPGVFDMKGGLVEIVFALRALAANGLVPAVTPVVFVNADEEVGSLDSRRTLIRLAQGAARALVLEGAAGREGMLKMLARAAGVSRSSCTGGPPMRASEEASARSSTHQADPA